MPPIPTIASFKAHGLTRLLVFCSAPCWHHDTISIEGLDDSETVVSLSPKVRCSSCGRKGVAQVRPDWDSGPKDDKPRNNISLGASTEGIAQDEARKCAVAAGGCEEGIGAMIDRREILKMFAAIAVTPAIPYVPALAADKTPPLYALLTITHPDLQEPIYIASGPDAVQSRGKTHLPMLMNLTMVDDEPRVAFEVPPEFQLLFESFRQAADVKIEIAFGDNLDTPEPLKWAKVAADGTLFMPKVNIETWRAKPPPLDLWS